MALTDAQREIRKVGGSDVAIILGLSPFKTELELYHEKRGTLDLVDFSDNEPVEAGNVLEDGIAELAERRMSRAWGRTVKLRRSNRTIIKPQWPWLTIHIDRDVVGEDRGVECKNVGARAARDWGKEGTDDIPTYYLPQVHTYMLVMNYPVWTVAAYFGGAEMRLYEIERSALWDELIIDRTKEFWQRVVDGHPPQLDFGGTEQEKLDKAARIKRVLERLYAGTDGTTVQADETATHYFNVMIDAAKKAALYQQTAEGAENHLKLAMSNAAAMVFPGMPGWSFTRKQVTRKEYTATFKESKYIKTDVKAPPK
jgi:putative phage-type endonuclease